MLNNKILAVLIVLFLLSIDSSAQSPDKKFKSDSYRAIHWTMEEGLPVNIGNVMIKDINGFLWSGSFSGELSRFDGAMFKKYIPDQNNNKTINSDVIFSFVEDSLNNLWIGTEKGLSRYDIRADTFTNISSFDSVNPDKRIIPFWSTKAQVYCLESDRITTYNINSLEKKQLLTIPKSININRGSALYSIFDQKLNCIWMLEGLSYSPSGLLQIFLDNRKPERYLWPCNRKSIKHRHDAEGMQYDASRNSIWLNSGDGLLQFTLADKKFYSFNAFNEYVQLEEYDRYVGIDFDKHGRIWVATAPQGILVFDPGTEQVTPLFSELSMQQTIARDNLHIYCDREGIGWVSYYMSKGIAELLPYYPAVTRYSSNPKFKDSLSSNAIFTIIPSSGGKLWMGTRDGINIFDPVTEKFKVLREKDLPGIKGKLLIPLHIDTVRQKVWIKAGNAEYPESSDLDVYELDIKTNKSVAVTFTDGRNKLDTLLYAPTWVNPYKRGFIFHDENHGIFELMSDSPVAMLVVPFKEPVSRVVLAEEKFLFLAIFDHTKLNATFENKNGKWTKVAHLMDSVQWSSMYYNKFDQTYWVSLKNKWVHYDKNFRLIKTYTTEDGYKGVSVAMLSDASGDIWFTNLFHQVGHLDLATGIISALSEADGYQKQYIDFFCPSAKDLQGNLYFGGLNNKPGIGGLDRVHPEKYSSSITSSVYIRSLLVNQKQISFSAGVNYLEKLSLPYYQNTISIETGIIDFFSMGKGQLRYKLVSKDKSGEWQYAPAYYTIRYDGLVSGEYKLIIQSSNAGKVFNSAEKILMIIIHPPFWQTWWFRILAGVIGIAVIYSIIQWRSKALKARNAELEQKVSNRTRELNDSLKNLRATQAQLIHSEKMASLGELTAGIAHEIQNPLNFVNNFSEVNSELVAELKAEIDKGNFDEVRLIADDLLENETKINHHGKRADAIVKSMLQHSRIGTRQTEPTDINALVDEYLRLTYHGLRAKDKSFNATLKTDFDPSMGGINVIPQDIGRVLLNLFNNAFYAVSEKKASPHSTADNYTPTISVQTKRVNDSVEIRITDNGSGIPQKTLEKIFQPFFTTKPAGHGTGLGLSLSFDIIKAHGGIIKVDTKEGEGSGFIIVLPVKE